MKIFASNPGKMMSNYGKQFESGMMSIIRMRARKRVSTNTIYQEYIKDPHHVHLKATHWTSVIGFCRYLAKTNRVTLEETDKGNYITYLDKDPLKLARQKAMRDKEVMDISEQEKIERRVQRQLEYAKSTLDSSTEESTAESNLLQRPSDEKSLAFTVVAKAQPKRTLPKPNSVPIKAPKKRRVVESFWIRPGIIVKVLNRDLDSGRFFKKKAVVTTVEEGGIAVLTMVKCQSILRLHQDQLETVIPGFDKTVTILSGSHAGSTGVIIDVIREDFAVYVKVAGISEPLTLKYTQVSKSAPAC